MKGFGINEFAARLPNAICGILTLLLLFRIGKKLISPQFGIWWSLLYAASFLPHLYFKSGIIDPWFNLFIFAGVYHLIKLHVFEEENKVKNISLAGVFIGLGIMTKGPVALLIFLLTYSVYILLRRFKGFIKFKYILRISIYLNSAKFINK